MAGDARRAGGGRAAPAGPRNADSYKAQPKAREGAVFRRRRCATSSEAAAGRRGARRSAPAPRQPLPPLPPRARRREAAAAPRQPRTPHRRRRSMPRAGATPAPAARATTTTRRSSDWSGPRRGKLVTGFSEAANLKGIDIGGKAGQPVLASAAGKVVYAGSGLRGYGKLVIIKHNKTYLSRLRAQQRDPGEGRPDRRARARRSPRWAIPTPTR